MSYKGKLWTNVGGWKDVWRTVKIPVWLERGNSVEIKKPGCGDSQVLLWRQRPAAGDFWGTIEWIWKTWYAGRSNRKLLQ